MNRNIEEHESLRKLEARVVQAEDHYLYAFNQHQRIAKEFDQAIESAGGSFALEKARLAMAAALTEVIRTQEVLVDLLLTRPMPSPEDDEQM